VPAVADGRLPGNVPALAAASVGCGYRMTLLVLPLLAGFSRVVGGLAAFVMQDELWRYAPALFGGLTALAIAPLPAAGHLVNASRMAHIGTPRGWAGIAVVLLPFALPLLAAVWMPRFFSAPVSFLAFLAAGGVMLWIHFAIGRAAFLRMADEG